jgi:hypothetical protein
MTCVTPSENFFEGDRAGCFAKLLYIFDRRIDLLLPRMRVGYDELRASCRLPIGRFDQSICAQSAKVNRCGLDDAAAAGSCYRSGRGWLSSVE